MKCCTNFHVPQRMDLIKSGDPLTFNLEPPAGQSFDLTSEISLYYNRLARILEQTFTFPS